MLFFLSNFGKTGTFEATLRVDDKVPELFNPVTGQIRKWARFKSVEDGTRVMLHVADRSDSFFVVFRDKPTQPSVVGASASPAVLELFYDHRNQLTAESAKAGTYDLAMSDGTRRQVRIEEDAKTFAIDTPWQTVERDHDGYSLLLETKFELPAGFGRGQRIKLDLGKVSVMAGVTLNGKAFDTLWMPPFVLDVTDVVKSGANRLRVRVTSTSNSKPRLGETVLLRTTTRTTIAAHSEETARRTGGRKKPM